MFMNVIPPVCKDQSVCSVLVIKGIITWYICDRT